jgi:CubicO group peptidase (beta-lactamase class C family)
MVLALLMATMGAYVAHADPPGALIGGFLLMAAAVLIAVRTARNRLPGWARRTALGVGVLIAASSAVLLHAATVDAPLFAQPSDVPSVSGPAPSPQWAAAVERARPIVPAAIVEQNLPGVSIAVGVGADVVWAEGFGWRDVGTRTPVTPATRFNIGTASSAVAPAVARLGLPNTGAEPATEWSPEAIGEPGEDFPPLTLMRYLIFQPIGLAPAEYPLPGDRATFYVPATRWRGDTTDPRQGRRLMYMRDLACCAGGKAFYSTPSDLVRFALATNANNASGELAGGSVMSMVVRRDKGIVVAVASNIAHANTAALARSVADVFAGQQP